MAAVPAAEQAVVIFDPHDVASWDFAEAAAQRGAKLWLRWQERSHVLQEPSVALRGAIDLVISGREVAALFPATVPAEMPPH